MISAPFHIVQAQDSSSSLNVKRIDSCAAVTTTHLGHCILLRGHCSSPQLYPQSQGVTCQLHRFASSVFSYKWSLCYLAFFIWPFSGSKVFSRLIHPAFFWNFISFHSRVVVLWIDRHAAFCLSVWIACCRVFTLRSDAIISIHIQFFGELYVLISLV